MRPALAKLGQPKENEENKLTAIIWTRLLFSQSEVGFIVGPMFVKWDFLSFSKQPLRIKSEDIGRSWCDNIDQLYREKERERKRKKLEENKPKIIPGKAP